MSSLSQFFSGNYVRKTQTFTTSGTFIPTQGLLNAGGIIDVDMRGGGGGGCYGSDVNGTGGDSRHVITYQVTSLSPLTVTIGAGGTAGYINAGAGGTTTFGSITVLGGGPATSQGGGNGNGNMGRAGQPSYYASNNGWNGPARVYGAQNGADYGNGGAISNNGYPGVVILSWWERS